MKSADRKAAIAAYKERKPVAGIYAVRCTASGQIWVGQAPNLETVRNRIWFTLWLGNDPQRSLHEEWTVQGAERFSFEELERLE